MRREGKWISATKSPYLFFEKDGALSYKKKKSEEKNEKEWKSVWKCKENGVSNILWKVNIGVTYENNWEWRGEGKKVLFTPHLMRIEFTLPKWSYFYTAP